MAGLIQPFFMKFYPLSFQADCGVFELDSLTGALLIQKKMRVACRDSFPQKLIDGLDHCNHPYTLKQTQIPPVISSGIFEAWASSTIIRLYSWNFRIAQLYASLPARRFDTAIEAIVSFRSMNHSRSQDELCLPRALFAAKTSRAFPEKGVVFIGVFLPSRNMHAWVIENGTLVDPQDRIWLNFRPVAALC
jgi:hypothetical protein